MKLKLQILEKHLPYLLQIGSMVNKGKYADKRMNGRTSITCFLFMCKKKPKNYSKSYRNLYNTYKNNLPCLASAMPL